MTPKEKANEIVGMMYKWVDFNASVQCALIAVEELINEQEVWRKAVSQNTGGTEESTYWQQVKTEIQNL